MAKAGDGAHVAPGLSREIINLMHRPGPRNEKRPAWKSDSTALVSGGYGFMIWRDAAGIDRLVVDKNGDINIKDAVTDVWSAAIVGADRAVTDWTNYKKALYWMADFGYDVPQRFSYDGVALDIDPFRERLSSLSLCAWKDRIWMFNVAQFVWNRLDTSGAYVASGYTYTNVSAITVVTSGITTVHWGPTSNVTAMVERANATTLLSSNEPQTVVLRSDMQGVSPQWRMPMTLEVFVSSAAPRNTTVLVGSIRRPTAANGYRYRVTVGGVTAVGEPAWGTVPGGITADGPVSWVNDGPDAFASSEFMVGTSLDNRGNFETNAVRATIPPIPDVLIVGARWKYGNTSFPTGWNFGPIIVALKDGLTDGDPRKRNYGQQFTVGKFFYEFFNMESILTGAIKFPNRIICTEAGIPREIRADVYFEVVDGEGGGTAIRPMKEFLCAYKRRSISVYQVVEGTAAARLPIRFVATFPGVGCIGTRAIEEFEGRHYFIGEAGVYVFDGTQDPQEITDDAVRETIFARTGTYVEDILGLAPILRIDEKNREVRIYTQSDRIHVYGIDSKRWTSIDIVKDTGGGRSTVQDLIYHRRKFYAIATTNGLVREDLTTVRDEVYVAGVVSAFDVTTEAWLHVFEQIPRTDMLIEELEIHHEIAGDQTGSTLEIAVSNDRGKTFPKQHTVTIPITTDNQPIRVPLWQSGADLTVRLRHKGATGPAFFNAFWIGAWTQDLGGELSDSVPATVSAAL